MAKRSARSSVTTLRSSTPPASPTYLVADSALYSAENLQKLAETSLKWITRVPATLTRSPGGPGPGRSLQTMAPLHGGLSLCASCHRAMVASRNAGSSSTPSSASRRPSAPSTSSGASRVTRKSKPSRRCAAPPLPVKRMPSRRSRSFAARLADHVSPRQHRLPHAPLWEAGAPRPWRPARPDRLPYRRSPGVAAHGPSGTCRPAQLFHPRDERTGRGPVIRPGGARRIQRASPGGTRVSLPQRPAVFGLLPLSQKTRAHHGPVDGHDGLFARLCGPRIPHPHGS